MSIVLIPAPTPRFRVLPGVQSPGYELCPAHPARLTPQFLPAAPHTSISLLPDASATCWQLVTPNQLISRMIREVGAPTCWGSGAPVLWGCMNGRVSDGRGELKSIASVGCRLPVGSKSSVEPKTGKKTAHRTLSPFRGVGGGRAWSVEKGSPRSRAGSWWVGPSELGGRSRCCRYLLPLDHEWEFCSSLIPPCLGLCIRCIFLVVVTLAEARLPLSPPSQWPR